MNSMRKLSLVLLLSGLGGLAQANLISPPTLLDINGDGHAPGGQATEHILLHASSTLGLSLDDLLRLDSATDFDNGVFTVDFTTTGHALISWDNLPPGDNVKIGRAHV